MAAVFFDMDGVLIDSEPLWHRAEIQAFRSVGLELTPELCAQTKGVRIDEVVDHWFHRSPWRGKDPKALTEEIVANLIDLVGTEGVAMRGVGTAVEHAARRFEHLALVSSSPRPIIDAVLTRLSLAGSFPHRFSGDDVALGKPHPEIYLRAAQHFAVRATECWVIEDSVSGCIAAKAARMNCIAVPEEHDPRFAIADVVLSSLDELDEARWAALTSI